MVQYLRNLPIAGNSLEPSLLLASRKINQESGVMT